MPKIAVRHLNHRDADVAQRIHALQVLAYLQEAALLGVASLPGTERGAADVRALDESFFGAFNGEQLVGALSMAWPSPQTVNICSLAVLPAHQRRGLGRSLLREVLRRWPGLPFTVATASANAPALAFYRREGFEVERHSTVPAIGLELVHLRRSSGALLESEPTMNPSASTDRLLNTPSDRDTAGARQAASVMVLRDSPHGPEVLMLRRAERDGDIRSGVWVFPGGVLDALDASLFARCEGDDDALASARLGLPAGGLRYAVAAVRECFEEVGLLFAQAEAQDLAAALREQARVVTGADFVALCARHRLRLDVAALRYHSHWLTPPGLPKRFDTRFYVARAPAGQVPQADQGEALEIAWLTPAAALDAAAKLKLLPVTRRSLQELGRFGSVQACLDEAALRRHPPRMMPRLGRDAHSVRPVLPDEWAYAEIARLDPAGRGDVHTDLQPLRVVTLSERVRRITCSNGSVMTGPGTNTYLLSAPGGPELAVLDPGPDDEHTEAHLQAVLDAAGAARITRIIVTHTHKDHSPAAARLRELTGATLIGRVAAHPEWQDPHFVPDHSPADGERVTLGPGCTLRAVATPGHASNHVCWLLEQERLLFTGDHVMQASTVVINPPDGHMGSYLASLQKLLEVPLDWFAPGHGFLMAEPHAEVRRLMAHRLGREAKLLAALQASGPCSAEALLPTVYGDVPAARHGIALRSLLAHLLKLADEGRAAQSGDARWRSV